MARWHFKAGQQVGGIFIQALEKSKKCFKIDVNRFGSSITKYCNQFTFRFVECIYGLKRCHYWFTHCHLLSIQ